MQFSLSSPLTVLPVTSHLFMFCVISVKFSLPCSCSSLRSQIFGMGAQIRTNIKHIQKSSLVPVKYKAQYDQIKMPQGDYNLYTIQHPLSFDPLFNRESNFGWFSTGTFTIIFCVYGLIWSWQKLCVRTILCLEKQLKYIVVVILLYLSQTSQSGSMYPVIHQTKIEYNVLQRKIQK